MNGKAELDSINLIGGLFKLQRIFSLYIPGTFEFDLQVTNLNLNKSSNGWPPIFDNAVSWTHSFLENHHYFHKRFYITNSEKSSTLPDHFFLFFNYLTEGDYKNIRLTGACPRSACMSHSALTSAIGNFFCASCSHGFLKAFFQRTVQLVDTEFWQILRPPATKI